MTVRLSFLDAEGRTRIEEATYACFLMTHCESSGFPLLRYHVKNHYGQPGYDFLKEAMNWYWFGECTEEKGDVDLILSQGATFNLLTCPIHRWFSTCAMFRLVDEQYGILGKESLAWFDSHPELTTWWDRLMVGHYNQIGMKDDWPGVYAMGGGHSPFKYCKDMKEWLPKVSKEPDPIFTLPNRHPISRISINNMFDKYTIRKQANAQEETTSL